MTSISAMLHRLMDNFAREFDETPTKIILPPRIFDQLALEIAGRLNDDEDKYKEPEKLAMHHLFGLLKIERSEPYTDPWLKQLKLRPHAE